MNPDVIVRACKVIVSARTNRDVRLRFGARKRAELLEQLRVGDLDKNDYRYQWLKASKTRVIAMLGDLASEFSLRYPHDAASLDDLIDIVESVLLQFNGKI